MKSKRKAFTLAEVLLSIGLLSVALLAVIGLFTSAIRFQASSQERELGVNIARRLLERIASEPNVVPPGPAVWTGGEMAFTPLDIGPPAFPPAPYPYEGGYALDVVLDNSTRPGMKLVQVVARWGNGRSVTLQTFIRQ
ncbi:MAG: prepilin-type N-terminal cleavage/methylation domain-containing protein [Candidatus Eremiobacteraeota bacterium]|nr:prepilin-type N-terminal cleavage/methylation domain-containing protein [Candidatus Eremiobacteraeota bacterium]